MAAEKNILMVVTSHAAIKEDHPTGLWLEEFATPYALFRQQGYRITVVSIKGGDAPIDPLSFEEAGEGPEIDVALAALKGTLRLDARFHTADYDALFFPGGHGTMFDLPDNSEVQRLVSEFLLADKVVAAVCHGPACLVGAKLPNGTAVVKGRRLTAFTDEEERAVELDQQMPFLLQSRLCDLGAEFHPAANWQENVVVDGKLVTGQNPQSSESATKAVIRLLS